MKRTKLNSILFFALFLAGLPLGLGAKTLIVSAEGDSASGKKAVSYNSIENALKYIVAGDTLFVREGVYVEMIWYESSGTAENPIVVAAYPGETPIIDGGGIYPTADYGALINLVGNYIHFIGFEVRNSNMNGVYQGGSAISMRGEYNEVREARVHDCWGNGIVLGGHNGLIEGCEVWQTCMSNENGQASRWDSALSSVRHGRDGVTTGAVLRGNTVYNNWGEGLSAYESSDVLIEDNIVYDNYSVNLYISDSQNVLAQRNIVYNTPDNYVSRRSYFGLGDERADKPRSKNIAVINNFLYNVDLWAFWSSGVPGSGLDNVLIANNTLVNGELITGASSFDGVVHKSAAIYNNICLNYQGASCSVRGGAVGVENLHFSNNLWYPNPPSEVRSDSDVLADPLLLMGGEVYPGQLSAEYFMVSPESPALDQGRMVDMVGTDFFRTPRDSSPDIGGHELIIAGLSLLVYPNPSDGIFTFLQGSPSDQPSKLTISSTSGKIIEVCDEPMSYKHCIDLGPHPAGAYIYLLTHELGTYSGVLIKSE